MGAVVAVLALVTVLLCVLVVALLRSHAEILRGLHDLGISLDPDEQPGPAPRTAIGVPAPRAASGRAHDVAGVMPGGGATAIDLVGTERLTLLAFLTTGCLTCREFWESLARPVDVSGARIVIVTKDRTDESEGAVLELAPATVPVVMSSSAWEAYGVEVAPYFVLVDGTRGAVIGEGAAASWEQVERLLNQAISDATIPQRARGAEESLAASGIGPGHPSLRPPLDGPRTSSADGEPI